MFALCSTVYNIIVFCCELSRKVLKQSRKRPLMSGVTIVIIQISEIVIKKKLGSCIIYETS